LFLKKFYCPDPFALIAISNFINIYISRTDAFHGKTVINCILCIQVAGMVVVSCLNIDITNSFIAIILVRLFLVSKDISFFADTSRNCIHKSQPWRGISTGRLDNSRRQQTDEQAANTQEKAGIGNCLEVAEVEMSWFFFETWWVTTMAFHLFHILPTITENQIPVYAPIMKLYILIP